MKGLSEIIGFFLILVILIAVVIPVAFYILSSPTEQHLVLEQTAPLSFASSLQKELVGVYPLNNKPIMLLYTNSSFYVINTGTSNITLPTLTFLQIYFYNGINYTPLLNSPKTLNLSDLNSSNVPFYGSVKSWSMHVPIGKSLIAVTSLGNVFVIPYVASQVNISSINVYTLTSNPTSPFNTSIGGVLDPFGYGSLSKIIQSYFQPNITCVIIGNYKGEANKTLPSYSTIAYYPGPLFLTPDQGVINGSFYGNIIGNFDPQGNITIESFSGSISLTNLFSGYLSDEFGIFSNNNYSLNNINLGRFSGQVIFYVTNNNKHLLILFRLHYDNGNYTGKIYIGNREFNATVEAKYFTLSLGQDDSSIFKYIYIYNSTYASNLYNYISQQLNNFVVYINNINGNTTNLQITASTSSLFYSISNAPFLSASNGLIKVNINGNSISLNLKNSSIQLVGDILIKEFLLNYHYNYNYTVMIYGNGSGEFYGIPPKLGFGEFQNTYPILSASMSNQNDYIVFENAKLLVYNALILPPINITATVVIVNNNRLSINLDYVVGTLSITYYYPQEGLLLNNIPSTGTLLSFTVSKKLNVTIPADGMKTVTINLSIPTGDSLTLLYYIYQGNSQIPLLATLFLQFHVQGTNIYIPVTLQSILNSPIVNE